MVVSRYTAVASVGGVHAGGLAGFSGLDAQVQIFSLLYYFLNSFFILPPPHLSPRRPLFFPSLYYSENNENKNTGTLSAAARLSLSVSFSLSARGGGGGCGDATTTVHKSREPETRPRYP